MKVVTLPIECIALFDEKGRPTPMRFRILSNDGNMPVKVDQVLHTEKQKIAGSYLYMFDCQSSIGNEIKIYQLRYELNTCKWILFKI